MNTLPKRLRNTGSRARYGHPITVHVMCYDEEFPICKRVDDDNAMGDSDDHQEEDQNEDNKDNKDNEDDGDLEAEDETEVEEDEEDEEYKEYEEEKEEGKHKDHGGQQAMPRQNTCKKDKSSHHKNFSLYDKYIRYTYR